MIREIGAEPGKTTAPTRPVDGHDSCDRHAFRREPFDYRSPLRSGGPCCAFVPYIGTWAAAAFPLIRSFSASPTRLFKRRKRPRRRID